MRCCCARWSQVLCLLLALLVCAPLGATWSILLVEPLTGEMAIASVTCLSGFNLRTATPVVMVGRGIGVCQSWGDPDGIRRPMIRSGFLSNLSPEAILQALAQVNGHSLRQYGILNISGDTATFTGSGCAQWAGGVTGVVSGPRGPIHYAVQGNILAGGCIEEAILGSLNTANDTLPAILMAAMVAAGQAGGDGRCSCSVGQPEQCGCPPVPGGKSGHCGYLLAVRDFDVDGNLCNQQGCADGDYFLELNDAFGGSGDPDPVDVLQQMFDASRQERIGVVDAIASETSFRRGDNGELILRIELRDWQGEIADPGLTVQVASVAAGLLMVDPGEPVNLGDGVWESVLEPLELAGTATLRVLVNDGIRPVRLMPSPQVCVQPPAAGQIDDCDGNGWADSCDLVHGILTDDDGDGIADSCVRLLRGDVTGDAQIDLADPVLLLDHLYQGASIPCRAAADASANGQIDLADPMRLLMLLFQQGPGLPHPWPSCGWIHPPRFDCEEAAADCQL